MTNRRYQQMKTQQLADAERAAQIAAGRVMATRGNVEAISVEMTDDPTLIEDYLAAIETRAVAEQNLRVADDWVLRCQAIVDEMAEARR